MFTANHSYYMDQTTIWIELKDAEKLANSENSLSMSSMIYILMLSVDEEYTYNALSKRCWRTLNWRISESNTWQLYVDWSQCMVSFIPMYNLCQTASSEAIKNIRISVRGDETRFLARYPAIERDPADIFRVEHRYERAVHIVPYGIIGYWQLCLLVYHTPGLCGLTYSRFQKPWGASLMIACGL